jgi:hypothetical protein
MALSSKPPRSPTTRRPRPNRARPFGFALGANGDRSLSRAFIDYDLPQGGFARWLGKLLGRAQTRWCVERMANDAAARFPLAAG